MSVARGDDGTADENDNVGEVCVNLCLKKHTMFFCICWNLNVQ